MTDTEKLNRIKEAFELKRWFQIQFPQDQLFYLKMEAACNRDIARIINDKKKAAKLPV